MAYNLKAFEQSDMSVGVLDFQSDFTAIPALKLESQNISTGIHRGIGPRFGMSPIPAQLTLQASGGTYTNIRQAEAANASGTFANRYSMFSVYPSRLHIYPGNTSTGTIATSTPFIWILGRGATEHASIAAQNIITSAVPIGGFIGAAFHCDSISNSDTTLGEHNTYLSPIAWQIPWNSQSVGFQFEPALQTLMDSGGLFSVQTARITVSGANIPQKWLIGKCVGIQPLNGSYNINFVLTGQPTVASRQVLSGLPYSIQTGNYNKTPRSLSVWNFTAGLTASSTFTYTNWTPDLATPTHNYNQSQSTASLTLGTANTFSIGVGTMVTALVYDETNSVTSSYDAVLVAGKNPSVLVYQDWMTNEDGTYEQVFDPTAMNIFPIDMPTKNILTGAAYTEDGTAKSTCFDSAFLYSSTAAGTVGLANTGILRANTSYELTFSYYNKRLNFETNVGTPGKVRTGAADFVNCAIGLPPIISESFSGSFNTGTYLPINLNDYEIRYYYRQLGSYEWLPAGSFDAAQMYCYQASNYPLASNESGVWLCSGPVAQVPGGQPGGFDDYSLLPKDNYDCVLSWNTRAFWSSKTNLIFSLKGNVFAYPIRNSVSCPNGEYRGMTIHAYPGDAEQRGRLIVWGSEECYIARFTGNTTLTNVQIGAGNVSQFALDGSDFTVERWTTCTAFQYRAAVVAEGELYYWGPKGVFHDNGTDFPDRISEFTIEPALFSLYDPRYTNQIFGHYSYRTKEIFWFYRSLANPTITSALVLNTRTGAFYPAVFNCAIDSIQDVDMQNTGDSQTALSGRRTIVSVRTNFSAAVNRPYYFDMLNTATDQRPLTDCLASAFTVTGSTIALTLDASFDAATLGTLVAGDLVTFSQAAGYSQAAIPDCIATFVSLVGNVLTATLPAGVSFPATFTAAGALNYIPLFFPKLAGIPWVISTQYWTPQGLQAWYRWLFTHLQLRVNLLPATLPYTFNMTYQTPISSSPGTKTLTLTNNSDANCQIYSPMPGPNQQFEGQGIRHKFSGVHPGGSWVLQYLCIYGEPQEGDQLQIFEE